MPLNLPLAKSDLHSDLQNLCVAEMVRMCADIVQGMKYLIGRLQVCPQRLGCKELHVSY